VRIILILVLLSVTILVALGIISLGLHALSELMSSLKGIVHTRGKRAIPPPKEDGDVGTIILPHVASAARREALADGGAASIETAALAMSRDMALIATDREGRITLFNPGAEAILGYRSDSVRGRSFTAFFVPDEINVLAQILATTEGIGVEGFECLVSRCLTGVVEEQEWTWVRSDSTPLSILLTATALREGGETAEGFLFVARKSSELRSLVPSPAAQIAPKAPAPSPPPPPVAVDCLPVS
jgi:PAS domain S-box-containing protein